MTVAHGLLDGDEFLADLDDVLDGLLHLLPDALGAGPGLLGDLCFEQIVLEPTTTTNSPFGCFATAAVLLRLMGCARLIPVRGFEQGRRGGGRARTGTARCHLRSGCGRRSPVSSIFQQETLPLKNAGKHGENGLRGGSGRWRFVPRSGTINSPDEVPWRGQP